jgi:putative 4-mercaptohistidine N1-methyltranferase
MNIYESQRLLDEYLLFHYGAAEEVMPHAAGPVEALSFPVRTVIENIGPGPRERALDLGCAVGRSSFELSRFCSEVLGIDFSDAFIAAARRLQLGEAVAFRRHEEAHRSTEAFARAPTDARPGRIVFERGDAMDLRPDLGTFDLIHAANLLCRLADPQRLLRRLPSLARPGATVVLATPCTWLAEFTPPDRWPDTTTFDWLRRHLDDAFALEAVRDQPFLIRETARKFQWSVALTTVWRRR